MEEREEIWFVYLLQSEKDGSYYVGMTKDINARLKEHNRGKSRYTKGKMPWKLMYSEKVGNPEEARMKEKYYKTSRGKNKLLSQLGIVKSLDRE